MNVSYLGPPRRCTRKGVQWETILRHQSNSASVCHQKSLTSRSFCGVTSAVRTPLARTPPRRAGGSGSGDRAALRGVEPVSADVRGVRAQAAQPGLADGARKARRGSRPSFRLRGARQLTDTSSLEVKACGEIRACTIELTSFVQTQKAHENFKPTSQTGSNRAEIGSVLHALDFQRAQRDSLSELFLEDNMPHR